jgi:GNAT superfamily N-acetyltransferase
VSLVVRPASWGELDEIASAFDRLPRATHMQRIGEQDAGDGVYFIAWRSEVPIGHLLLKLRVEVVSARARGYGCPEIEDLYVNEHSRNAGAGRRLLDAAEREARNHGHRRIGLSAGVDSGYDSARHLYSERGYEETATGEFWETWQIPEDDGSVRTGRERCTYLVRQL